MACKRCIVQGRVQGVWFRDTTRQRALELGLSGSAANRRDGSVEVIICGEAPPVETLCDWLWVGSPMSEVEVVRCEDWDGDISEGFGIG